MSAKIQIDKKRFSTTRSLADVPFDFLVDSVFVIFQRALYIVSLSAECTIKRISFRMQHFMSEEIPLFSKSISALIAFESFSKLMHSAHMAFKAIHLF